MLDKTNTFWKIYQLIFTVFSLYIMGDAFNRWDGVKYYASFLEFVPSVSLIAVLLSILAFAVTLCCGWFPNFSMHSI
jgi:hypothetical protein